MIPLKQSTAVTVSVGPFQDDVDGSLETGLTITQADVRLSKNGGAWAQKNSATSASHQENGWYAVALNATDTNTLGVLKLAIHEAGALPVYETYEVLAANVWDSLYGGTDTLDVQVTGIGASVITNASIATDAISGGKLATTAREVIADQVWDELRAGHVVAGSFGESTRLIASGISVDAVTAIQNGLALDADLDTARAALVSIDSRIPASLVDGRMDYARQLAAGTVDSGTTTTIVDAARTETEADYWVGCWLFIRDPGGPPKGQVRLVTGFNPGTDTLTFTPAVGVAPVAGQVYELLPAASLPAGGISAGGITAASFAAGAINGAALDATAVTKLRSYASGQADSGSTTTMVDAARVEPTVDHWKGSWILFTSGTLDGLARKVIGFDPTTDTLTFAPALPSAVGTHNYELLPAADGVQVSIGAGGIPVGAFAAGAIENASLATNAISSNKIANGAITSSKFLAGAIDAQALATDAVTEIQTGLLTSGALSAVAGDVTAILGRLPTSLVGGRIRALVEAMGTDTLTSDALATSAVTEISSAVGGGGGGGASAATIAAAVWDLPRAGHNVPGTFGEGVAGVLGNVTGSVASVVGAVGSIGVGGVTAGSIAAAAANKIADHVLRRSYGAARTSSDGDAVGFRSLLGLLSGAVNRFRVVGTQLTTYHEDDTTIFGTRTLTSSPGSAPLTGADTD